MRRLGRWLMLSLAIMGTPVAAQNEALWEELLGQVGLTRETAQLHSSRWRGGGRGSLSNFQALWDDWFLIEPTADKWTRELLVGADSLLALLDFAAARIDASITQQDWETVQATVTHRAENPLPLPEVIEKIHRVMGEPLNEEEQDRLEREAQRVPPPVARAASLLLDTCREALDRRNAALAACGTPDNLQPLFDEVVGFSHSWSLSAQTLTRVENIDMHQLMVGSAYLAAAMQAAEESLSRRQVGAFTFKWDTPLGRIQLTGDRANRHKEGGYLLLLDTGGDDVYWAGAGTTDAAHPISLLLDLSGNDRYEARGGFAFGGGVLGYGLLVDAGGDDYYRVETLGQGAGLAGVGALVDRDGDDTYETRRLAQAAAVYGVGLISDLRGDDRYYCFQLAQAMAGPRGCALLVDLTGDDAYEAEDKQIDYPSAQTTEHNVSFAQGASFGRRAHPGDGRSLAGGIGVLLDAAGNDTYSCGVFGQGTGYWYGLGMLVDLRGQDRYRGVQYAMGAAAHYAVAALIERSGDDYYDGVRCQSLGHGHDYSTGLLWDDSGNDVYNYPQATLASGRYSGCSVLADWAGKDTYRTAQIAAVPVARPNELCLGLFVDVGGPDQFPESDELIEPEGMWMRPKPDQDKAWGLGLDR